MILLPALAILAWRAPNRRGAFLRLAVSVPIMALWPLYLGVHFHRPFVFLTAQRSGWDRHLSAAGPLGGAWEALVAGWRAVRQLVAGSGHTYFSNPDHSAMYYAGLNLEQLAYAALLAGLGIYAWRVLGAAYGIFALGSLALPLSDPVPITPLLSMPRFALGVFPVFLVLGRLGARPGLNTAMLVGLRTAARDQPGALGAVDLGRLILSADGQGVSFRVEARFAHIAEVLAVCLERRGACRT